MTKISSQNTSFLKKVFPILWFGIIGLFLLVAVAVTFTQGIDSYTFLLGPAVVILFGYYITKKLIFNVADEVWDDGLCLLVKNRGEEERIDYKNIAHVGHTTNRSPARVTVTLKKPCGFGGEFTFLCPTEGFVPFKISKAVRDLLERIEKAKNG